MSHESEERASAAPPRSSMDFVGLAAAIAFIAVSPSAAAVTESSADQFLQGAYSAGASLDSPSFAADAGDDGSFLLAQSTDGTSDGVCDPGEGPPDCEEEEDPGGSSNSGSNSDWGEDAFHFEILPADHGWFDGIDLQDGFWYQVQLDYFNAHTGPPNESRSTDLFGPGGVGLPCLSRGGAVMFSLKARKLGCWTSAKARPVRGLKAPTLGPAAQRVLASCRFASGSVTLRNGAFACVGTPWAVVRKAARSAPVRPSPVRRSQG